MKSNLYRFLLPCAAAFAVAGAFCGCSAEGIVSADNMADQVSANDAESSDNTEKRLTGDANCNGLVDLPDAVLVARAMGGYADTSLTATGKLNADVDLDGLITGKDLNKLLRYLCNAISSLDPSGSGTTATSSETTTTTTTASETTTTTTSSETTTSSSTTAATTTQTTATSSSDAQTTPTVLTTTTTTTAATTSAPEADALIVDSRTLPLGLSTGSLIAAIGSATEELVVAYQNEDMKFFVYAADPAQTHIAVVAHDTVVGYFAFGTTYSVPAGYTATEYIDKYSQGTGKVYAVQILKSGYTLNMNNIRNKSDLSVMSKLNFYGVNALRALNGIGALQWNAALASVSLYHSSDMADNNYFAHNSLSGETPKNRIDAAGIACSSWGENVDCGYTDPFWALYGWYTSENGHRDNILKAGFTDIGIGFAYNADSSYKFYGTQDYITAK